MARGFILGALSGTVIAVGFGTLASVLVPVSPQGGVPDVGDDVALTATPKIDADPSPQLPGSESSAPPSPSVVLGATPKVDDLAALDTGAVQAAQVPATDLLDDLEVFASLEDPATQTDIDGLALPANDPVTRNQPLMSLALPSRVEPVAITTSPSQVQSAPLRSAVVGTSSISDETVEISSVSTEAPTLPQVEISTPAPLPLPATIEQAPNTASQIIPASVSGPDVSPTAPEAPQPDVVAQLVPALVPGGTQSTQTLPEATEPETPDAMQAPAVNAVAPAPRPRIGKPAISLTERNAGIVINRPVASDPDAPTEETVLAEPAAEAAVEGDDDARPVDRYRQPFENAEGKPLMSVVLIDTGAAAIEEGTGIDALRDFPYPLSFAVDSALPDAQERIAMYRNEGFEVLSMIDLPPGALPSDAETTLGVILPQMGEIVGVLEGDAAGLQESRDVSDQVTAILVQSGHGLITQDNGLNTMPNLARKAGVPAVSIFRDFDGNDQNERTIRRFLDQAAFKAGQEGSVIMLGRLRSETISALLVWGLQDRAGQIALAPVSAVLLDTPAN